jgi:[FeFe] hydrogenase H-cluster maturation GTPase HydF
MSNQAPKGIRLHIGLFGRTNVGKSSLLNAITQQNVAIVSAEPGTTTDPVEKAMELLPLGPVLFIDTGGIDDRATLGAERVARTMKAIDRTDLAILVTEPDGWGDAEEGLLHRLQERQVPVMVVVNKRDQGPTAPALREHLERAKIPFAEISAKDAPQETAARIKEKLLQLAPEEWINSRPIVCDLLQRGDTVILVVPLDEEAPKGRLILPVQQVLRECLEYGVRSYVIGPDQVAESLDQLREPPRLVITDSQAFATVMPATPPEIPLTSFSILFARFKGDLDALAQGARALMELTPESKVLIAEACTHHPFGEDIGRVKIPRLLRNRVGAGLTIDVASGKEFPEGLADYDVVIHCGGCVLNRRGMLSRILRCREQGVPVTNYGMAIAAALGNLDRVLRPFETLRGARPAA